ncbi:CPBP family intramembrane metalloprotease [Paenibacillus doosanensis]|uniref:CAAX amino terminal protease self- immunity n=1 Tax=Paenibacillus konkukensis TaxID=2020716 RepID=A0ABY4RKF9_9BACL|nr:MULTISPECIES: CPBP family intramembrane glutamic endopeptidase [Paenibacillus]MCS7462433.1 CPBP family intramembrane metalloprotease [Paenibacillus doosanensis]UQZ81959.1 CAAX amino terminal protease self- immunity [Paenibacillus konkukensis]
MKKFNFKQFKFRSLRVDEIDERYLIMNLYVTQLLVLVLGSIIMLFHRPSLAAMFSWKQGIAIPLWGVALAAVVLIVDVLISRWVPPEVTDDGGINEMLFRNRPLWHITVMSFIVAVCEEWLFRGAIQSFWGPYWTSILFAAIHIRYLQHWLMTGLVFGISYGLGWIYIQTGSLWAPIIAHFVIDFIMGCIIRYRRED